MLFGGGDDGECGVYMCPHCGELVDTSPDLGGGETQVYVEDCTVCCRPNRIHAVFSPEDDGFHVSAEADDE
jgi:hypothetical protein